jgi:hypothetical protein
MHPKIFVIDGKTFNIDDLPQKVRYYVPPARFTCGTSSFADKPHPIL